MPTFQNFGSPDLIKHLQQHTSAVIHPFQPFSFQRIEEFEVRNPAPPWWQKEIIRIP